MGDGEISKSAQPGFIFIAALPKSASSYFWLVASALQEATWRANPARIRGPLPDPFSSLSLDVLGSFLEGGVYKSHAPCDESARSTLDVLGCKTITVLRHPADFLVALWCHLTAKGPIGYTAEFRKVLGHLPVNFWRMDFDDGLARFITDGVLLRSLEWMSAWAMYSVSGKSVLVTYEDMMSNFEAVINRLSVFIREEQPTDDVMAYLREVRRQLAIEGNAKPSSHYPRGWTGEIGVWCKYMTGEHIRLYNEAVTRFISSSSRSAYLGAAYQDLAI